MYILEGDVVYFDCNIAANPPVTEVGWRFNDEPLYTNIYAGIKIQNQSLLLHKISRKYSGNYSCIAANSEGEGVSDGVAIDVHCKFGSFVRLFVHMSTKGYLTKNKNIIFADEIICFEIDIKNHLQNQ